MFHCDGVGLVISTSSVLSLLCFNLYQSNTVQGVSNSGLRVEVVGSLD